MKTRSHILAFALAVVSLAARVVAEDQPAPCDDTKPEEAAAPEDSAEQKTPKTSERSKKAERTPTRLEEVVVEAKRPLSAASSDEIRARDYELRPHGTTQEILNNIPGLVAAQHQGGGKATQWLVRGFDADHGTDIAVSVDDLPINLRTHAHGQGYADLNPLIPEVVERLQLVKGPYFPQFGDFATVAALNVVTKDEFKENFILAEGGSFDVMRYVGGASRDFGSVKALVAGQAYFADGPFINPQDFSRYNTFTKFTVAPSATSKAQLSTSVYDGSWHGSGQIPLRLVSAGLLDRFGAIDPTEGGHSDREDVNLHYENALGPQDRLDFQAYGTRYKLQLYSDFTFYRDTGLRFREDPSGGIFDTDRGRFVGQDDIPVGYPGFVPGDGIEQNDQRYLYGGRARYTRYWILADRPVESQLAVETRNDDINVALHRQVRRNRFFSINKLSVSERSLGTYVSHQIFLTDWIRFETGLRGDVFFVDGRNRLPRQPSDPNFTPVSISGSTTASIVSPKANLILTPVPNTDFYFNFGEGYHSNDARDALTAIKSDRSSLLTGALGYEFGARTRQFERLDLAAAIWLLDLDSELVFSGDAGNQETGSEGGNLVPAPASRRWGVDFEARYQLTRWLVADYDLSSADAYFTASSQDGRIQKGNAVPLAPTLLMNGGLTAELGNGLSVALRTRFLDDRPANEDRSLTARGYTLLDLIGRYRWRNVEVSLALMNLTDTDWREAQFADNTCVRREVKRNGSFQNGDACIGQPGQQNDHTRTITLANGKTRTVAVDPPSDIHFTPGNPFGVRAGIKVLFD